MHPNSKTPAATGASRDCLDGCFRDSLSPLAIEAQFLIAAHQVRPRWAAIVAAPAFGGRTA